MLEEPDEFGWSPGCGTVEEVKFWDKYHKIVAHKSDQGDGDNALAMKQTYIETGVKRFKRIPPNVSEEYRETCLKFYTPQDKAKLTGKPNSKVGKYDEYLRTGEKITVCESDFTESNPPDRMSHRRLVVPDEYKRFRNKRTGEIVIRRTQVNNLLDYLAMFANFDYIWTKYIHKKGDGRPLRFFWWVDEQIMTVTCCRFGKDTKSAKKDPTAKVREHTSTRGLKNWNYPVKTNGRKRDPYFGPMGKQGYPERDAKCLLIIPPERQLTYQPQKGNDK